MLREGSAGQLGATRSTSDLQRLPQCRWVSRLASPKRGILHHSKGGSANMASNEEIPANGEDASRDLVVPEVVEEPRRGTLAWLETQERVDFQGLSVPACHRIPAGAVLAPPSEDRHCRVVVDGAQCRGRSAGG